MQIESSSRLIAVSVRVPRLARAALLAIPFLASGAALVPAQQPSPPTETSPAPASPTPAPAAPAPAAGTPAPAVAAPAPTPTAAPALPPVVPFQQAVSNAANTVLTNAAKAAAGDVQQSIVIDPLVDGVTGAQSRATDNIQGQILNLVHDRYPQFVIKDFSPGTINAQPYVLIGTFTPVNSENKTAGTREAFRFCLVMADLKSGKIVAKGVARAQLNDVDATPLPAFAESPVWSEDAAVQSYISTCQASKVGDPINKTYLDGIITAATVGEAIAAYDAGRYADALQLYNDAAQTPAGDQLRVYNGVYLSSFKLHRRDLPQTFDRVLDYGYRKNVLALKILFGPGTASFDYREKFSSQYPIWLQQIAHKQSQSYSCLEIVGHTSATGAAVLNDRLSELRAQRVKNQLDADAPQIRGKTTARGVGSSELMVGTGRDDESDALDRRVEFKLKPSC
jgi:outer membrane protein OmpA-like peptidoglycan-associated protein